MYGCKDTRFNYDDMSDKTYDADRIKKKTQITLRKYAYSNILKILPPKKMKISR